MTIDARERLRRIDPAPLDVAPPSGTLAAAAVIHEIERRMGMDTRDTTNNTETPPGVTEQIRPGAIADSNDTPTKREGKRRWSGALVAAAAFGIIVLVFGAAALLATGDGEDTAAAGPKITAGPVTIETQEDFSRRPVVGTFEVTEGADALQCSRGTFGDEMVTPLLRVFVCEDGPNQGTFTASFKIQEGRAGSSDEGTWSIVEGSDDFVSLAGSGEWIVLYGLGGTDQEVGTWTGDIESTS